MNLTEFRMRAMNDEVQMIEDFNFFEQKVASFKHDLYLSPYAKINEILAWCELLIKYEKQIDLLCLEAKQAIQDKLNKLNPTTIESHASVDDKTISVWSGSTCKLYFPSGSVIVPIASFPFIVIETPINASFSSAEVTVPEIVRF